MKTKIDSKIIGIFLAVFLLAALAVPSFAESTVNVKVSIAVGSVQLAAADVEVRDVGGDGVISIDDALSCVHEKYCPAGAAGYVTTVNDYGTTLLGLWGTETSYSYGYNVDNAPAFSLDDPVSDGSYVYAYAYTDTENWSDTYSFFENTEASVSVGGTVTFRLFTCGYDENWMPVTMPCAGAKITVDGSVTDSVTDENGCVTVPFDKTGKFLVSAVCDTTVLVPPVCNVTVLPANEEVPLGDVATLPSATIGILPPATSDLSILPYLVSAAAFAGAVWIGKRKMK